MKKILAILVMGAFALTVFDGCSQRVGDFTLISTKNVDIGGKYKKLDNRFTGSDSRIMILYIPLGFPNLKTAVDRCIESGKGDLLTNAVIEYNTWTVILVSGLTYEVTGDVWVKASLSDLSNPGVEVFQLTVKAEGLELMSMSNPTHNIRVDYFALH